MTAAAPPSTVLDRVCDRLFLLGLLAAVAYVLWLPLVPTGDGPVHLYYADVLWSLLRHQPTYAHDYAIRHLLAPYLVHYLALISLEHFLTPAGAEKLFVAIIFVTLASGFRALARVLGPHSGVASLWMLPLLFSWSLGGGFLNCCFATGIMFFAFAVWTRLGQEKPGAPPWLMPLAFTLLLGLLVLSHPIPLLVLLLFTASDLLLQLVGRAVRQELHPPAKLLQGLAFAFTCIAFIAPVLLAQKGQAAAVLPAAGFHRDIFYELLTGMRLGLFAGLNLHSVSGWLAIPARVLLVAIVPGTAVLLLRNGWRSQDHAPLSRPAWRGLVPSTPAARLALIAILYLAATVFFPRSLNNSYFFPQRMWDIVWPLVLASGSAAVLTRKSQRLLGALGMLSILLVAMIGLPALARIAHAQEQLAHASLPGGARGLLLEADSAEQGRGAPTTYPVWFWAGARAFETSHSVLLNSPWLGLTILPVRDADGPPAAQALLDRGLPSVLSESPLTLTHAVSSQPADAKPAHVTERNKILARADFLFYVHPPVANSWHSADDTAAEVHALLADQLFAWQCGPSTPLYVVCTHARQ